MASQRKPDKEAQNLWRQLSSKDRPTIRLEFIESLVVANNLSPTARRIGLLLVTRFFNQSPSNARYGCAWPSQDTLQQETGRSRRMVQYALEELETDGWFSRIRTKHYIYQPIWQRRIKAQSVAPSEVTAKAQSVAPSNGHDTQFVALEGANSCTPKAQPVAPKPFKEPTKESNGASPRSLRRLNAARAADTPLRSENLRSIEHDLTYGRIGPLTAARRAYALGDNATTEADRLEATQIIEDALAMARGQPSTPVGKMLGRKAEVGIDTEQAWRELINMEEGALVKQIQAVQENVR